jgi:hypothetical protein
MRQLSEAAHAASSRKREQKEQQPGQNQTSINFQALDEPVSRSLSIEAEAWLLISSKSFLLLDFLSMFSLFSSFSPFEFTFVQSLRFSMVQSLFHCHCLLNKLSFKTKCSC